MCILRSNLDTNMHHTHTHTLHQSDMKDNIENIYCFSCFYVVIAAVGLNVRLLRNQSFVEYSSGLAIFAKICVYFETETLC